MPEITGTSLRLDDSPEFIEALQTADEPLPVEDVTVDRRTRNIQDELKRLGTHAMLVLPVRRHRDPQPIGALFFEAPTPRTWSPKEGAALERLAPLIALAIDNAVLREGLDRAEASISEYERRLGAVRGIVGGVVHDTDILVGGLMGLLAQSYEDTTDPDGRESAAALGRQIDGVLAELTSLESERQRACEVLDLNTLAHELAPALRVVAGSEVRLLTRPYDTPLPVAVHRSGIERAILNLVVHVRNARLEGQEFVLETRLEGDRAVLVMYGDALAIDDTLLKIAQTDDLGLGALEMGLWLAHCEVMLHGGALFVASTGEPPVGHIRLSLPLLTVAPAD
jgi:hypothetical protein